MPKRDLLILALIVLLLAVGLIGFVVFGVTHGLGP